MADLDTLEIFRPKSNHYDKNIVEVYIPPPETPENWPPVEKPPTPQPKRSEGEPQG